MSIAFWLTPLSLPLLTRCCWRHLKPFVGNSSLEVDKIVFHDAQIEKAKKATAACYAKHGVNTKRAYGDVFKRNGDWPEAQKELEELVARQSKVSLGEVSKQVNDLTEIMDRFGNPHAAEP